MQASDQATLEINAKTKGSSKQVDLELGGVHVKVLTDVTPAFLKQVRELVDRKFEDISTKAGGALSASQSAVLLCYNLAEELLHQKERSRQFKNEIAERSEKLLNRVESLASLK